VCRVVPTAYVECPWAYVPLRGQEAGPLDGPTSSGCLALSRPGASLASRPLLCRVDMPFLAPLEHGIGRRVKTRDVSKECLLEARHAYVHESNFLLQYILPPSVHPSSFSTSFLLQYILPPSVHPSSFSTPSTLFSVFGGVHKVA